MDEKNICNFGKLTCCRIWTNMHSKPYTSNYKINIKINDKIIVHDCGQNDYTQYTIDKIDKGYYLLRNSCLQIVSIDGPDDSSQYFPVYHGIIDFEFKTICNPNCWFSFVWADDFPTADNSNLSGYEKRLMDPEIKLMYSISKYYGNTYYKITRRPVDTSNDDEIGSSWACGGYLETACRIISINK